MSTLEPVAVASNELESCTWVLSVSLKISCGVQYDTSEVINPFSRFAYTVLNFFQ